MADHDAALLAPTPEHRRIAATQYERARQAVTAHNYDYAIDLLLTCCKLDPANLIYRQKLRQIEKAKYRNNLRGSWLSFLTAAPAKTKLRFARQPVKVLEHGEQVLKRNPWHTPVQLAMAKAAEDLGLLDVAVWILEQARQKNPKRATVNRPLAGLYERQGNFKQAIALWDQVAKANPKDDEAGRKSKDLAATSTIVHGHYEEAARGEETTAYREPEAAPQKTPATPRAAGAAAPHKDSDEPPGPPKTADEIRLGRVVEPLRAKIIADPTNANHYLQLAEAYKQLHFIDEARRTLQEGLGPTGQNFDIHLHLAQMDIDPFRENLKLTEDRLRAHPEDDSLRRIRVQLLKEINTREMDLFRQRADRYPSDLGPRLELGIRLLRANKTDESIHELQQARRDPRHRWRALLYLGYCFKAKNNWLLAKRNFEEALQSVPAGEESSRMEMLFQLAQGAADEQDWRTAVAVGNDLANLDFSYRDIGRLLDEWQDKLKQLHAAS